jgi:hypothetical protein
MFGPFFDFPVKESLVPPEEVPDFLVAETDPDFFLKICP